MNFNSTKKLKIAVVIALVALLLLSSLIVIFNKNNSASPVFANQAIVWSTDIKDNYSKNENVTFPETVTISYNGQQYDGKFMGYENADGNINSLNYFNCNQIGIYNVLYLFNADNKDLIAKKSFVVNNSLIEGFSNANSKIEYGNLTYIPKSNPQKTQGLILTLGEGDVFTFNQPINVKNNDVTDLINFYPTQIVRHWETQSIGYQNDILKKSNLPLLDYPEQTIDCNRIYVNITDAYNPNNVVQLQLKFSSNYTSRSMSASTNSVQGAVAVDPYSGDETKDFTRLFSQVGLKIDESDAEPTRYMVWDGVNSLIRGSEVLWLTGSSYKDGGENDAQKGANKFDLSWKIKSSNNSNLVFFSNTPSNSLEDLKNKNENRLINDISNENLSTTGDVFKGFTNGEAYVSIVCDSFVSGASSTQIEIYSIGEYFGDALKASNYIDDKNPNIVINGDSENKASYVGVVNQAITIPSATAYDVNFAGNISTLVYYNYGAQNQTLVSVSGKKFIPTQTGTYSIVYRASDAFGNSAEKIIKINVIRNNENPYGINMSAKPIESCAIGDIVTLPAYAGVNYNGEVSYKISVENPNGEKVQINSNGQFTANALGKFKITYQLTDQLYTQEYLFEIEVVASDAYFYQDLPISQNYYIQNATYAFDDGYVYHLENGSLNKYLADVYVRYDKTGDFVKAEDRDKICIAKTGTAQENAQFVEFKYGYNLPNNTVLFSNTFGLKDESLSNILNVNYLGERTEDDMVFSTFDIGKYFLGDVTTQTVELAKRITDTKGQGNNRFAFANTILFNSLSLRFSIPEGHQNFDGINFYLTDVKDANNQLKISISFKYYHTYASINDGKETDVTHFLTVNKVDKAEIKKDGEKVIRFQPNSNKLSIKTAKEVSLDLPEILPSECYFEIEFVNVKGQASIDFTEINSQAMSAETDNGSPLIQVKSSAGNYVYGSIVPIYPAIVSDVLSPVHVKNLKLTVRNLSTRQPIKDVNGLLLQNVPADQLYYIEAVHDKIQVLYDGVIDGYGNNNSYNYNIFVVDNEKPIANFNDGANQNTIVDAKVGEEITIKDFTVSDNKSTNDKLIVKVMLYNANNNFEKFIEGNKVTINRKGLFCIRVFVQDEAGNVGHQMYYVNVK